MLDELRNCRFKQCEWNGKHVGCAKVPQDIRDCYVTATSALLDKVRAKLQSICWVGPTERVVIKEALALLKEVE